MKLSVVVDQPWQVPADVLVVPVAADPSFEGQLGELDRRSGGELRALREFGELTGKKYSTSLAPGGEVRAPRILTVGVGSVEKVDRETVVHVAATAIRRLGGRRVRSMAVWLDTLATVEGGWAGVAESVTRGVVEGGFEPATIYRDTVDSAPPKLDELILVAPGAGAERAATARGAERGRIIGEGANRARLLANRAANDLTPAGARRRGARDREGARPLGRRDRPGAGAQARDGHVRRGGAGERQPAPDDRHALGQARARRTRSGGTSRSSARASASTRAGSASSPPSAWKT